MVWCRTHLAFVGLRFVGLSDGDERRLVPLTVAMGGTEPTEKLTPFSLVVSVVALAASRAFFSAAAMKSRGFVGLLTARGDGGGGGALNENVLVLELEVVVVSLEVVCDGAGCRPKLKLEVEVEVEVEAEAGADGGGDGGIELITSFIAAIGSKEDADALWASVESE